MLGFCINPLSHIVKGSRSVVSDSLRFPWTVAYQDPQSMGFSRQEYWSGLPLGFPKFYSEFAAGKDPFLMAQMIMNLPVMQETWV